jgi:hypothetical protein
LKINVEEKIADFACLPVGRDCRLSEGGEMDRRELEERTKIFSTNVIQLISTLSIRKEKRHCEDSE